MMDTILFVCFENAQMNSIYEGKLPISRAKMASITRSAIKAIKVNLLNSCGVVRSVAIVLQTSR